MFDQFHADWEPDGPDLRLEFSRVSKTRGGALTLVIDSDNGTVCRVSYARSNRVDPEDAIRDLQEREGTTRMNVGYCFGDGSRVQGRDAPTLAAVKAWAQLKGIDVTIWTDLRSNFEQVTGEPFSIAAALAHFQSLTPDARVGAAEYVSRAPEFVQTALRAELSNSGMVPASKK